MAHPLLAHIDKPKALTLDYLADFTQDPSLLLCHELRTPLTSIQGALKLLGGEHFGSLSEDGQQLLAIAISNAERLVRLANAIEKQPTPQVTVLSESKVELLHLENDLHQAVKQQDFYLLYQPIISLEKNRIIGFEALARWKHITRGEISPEIFIPLAEKAGLIYELGFYLLEQACQRLCQWQTDFPSTQPVSVSINLSAIQLLHPQLVDKISQVLAENKISPQSLKIEITESALIENKILALETLVELQRLGIQLYIDDFGTGYSSLGRLQELPFDTLKIDRSFIQNKNWIMSEAILMLARRLDLDVIVEGVETLEDFMCLKQLGCQKMQGYFFSKPESAAATTAMLAQQNLEKSPDIISRYISKFLGKSLSR